MAHEHSHSHSGPHSHDQSHSPHSHSHDHLGQPCLGHHQPHSRSSPTPKGTYSEPEGSVPIADPLTDPAELRALTSCLSSFYLYRRATHLHLTHWRRRDFYKLPLRHRRMLSGEVEVRRRGRKGRREEGMEVEEEGRTVDYLAGLRMVDEAVDVNAELAERIFASGVGAFGVPEVWPFDDDDGEDGEEKEEGKEDGKEEGEDRNDGVEDEKEMEEGEDADGLVSNQDSAPTNEEGEEMLRPNQTNPTEPPPSPKKKLPWWESHASHNDIDKAISTLKQFYRDWSHAGLAERTRCYTPILTELESRFPDPSVRPYIKVLTPGAGLCRLPFEIVLRGFWSQGNEVSYHMLAGSNWVLNCAEGKDVVRLHPWIHGFSNHVVRGKEGMLRQVTVPDVWPEGELTAPSDAHPSLSQAAERFSMIAGDFLECYGGPDSKSKFDAVATVFFIDTAPNVLEYLETIYRILKPGGVWINLGPLLWHWEGRDVPKLDGGAGSAGGKGTGAGEGKGIAQGGKVELTMEEVVTLVEMVGFDIVKRGWREGRENVEEEEGRIRTGYLQDERSLLKYEYLAEFWVAEKPIDGGEEEGEEEEDKEGEEGDEGDEGDENENLRDEGDAARTSPGGD